MQCASHAPTPAQHMPVCKRHSRATVPLYSDLLEIGLSHDSSDQGVVCIVHFKYLCHIDILEIATLMPNITDSLTSTQLTDGLNVYPHQLNLQHCEVADINSAHTLVCCPKPLHCADPVCCRSALYPLIITCRQHHCHVHPQLKQRKADQGDRRNTPEATIEQL